LNVYGEIVVAGCNEVAGLTHGCQTVDNLHGIRHDGNL